MNVIVGNVRREPSCSERKTWFNDGFVSACKCFSKYHRMWQPLCFLRKMLSRRYPPLPMQAFDR